MGGVGWWKRSWITCFWSCLALCSGGVWPTESRASTFVLQEIPELTAAADYVVVATVGEIRFEARADGGVDTRVGLDVEYELLGGADLSHLVLAEPGGRVGDIEEKIFGSPEYRLGERVLVFVGDDGAGRLRTVGMAMGKFRVVRDQGSRALFVRHIGEGVTVFDPVGGRLVDESGPWAIAAADALEQIGCPRCVSDAELIDQLPVSDPFESTAEFQYSSSSPARWFQPDDGQPVAFRIDPSGDAGVGAAASLAAVHEAMDAWSEVIGANLQLVDGGPLPAAQPFAECSGDSRIVFNDPFGEITDPVNCGGVLAVGGYCAGIDRTTVNGQSFRNITLGRVTINAGLAGCPYWDRCALAEILAHELGHALGFGHSPVPDSIMRNHAYLDGRCARLGEDDVEAVSFVYPSGPPPAATATLSPSWTATRTLTATATRTPTPVPPQPTATASAPRSISISGSVRYYAGGAPVAESVLTIAPSGAAASSDADGRFSLSTEVEDAPPALRAEKAGDFDSAVSSLDAAFILQHVVGARELSSSQELACDVTGDGHVTPLDAVRVLDLAVGRIEHFPATVTCGSDWIFVASRDGAERSLLSCEQPLAVGDGESLQVEAALLGDCTGNWGGGAAAAHQRIATSRSSPRARIGRLRRRGGRALLPIYIHSTRPYHSIDLELRYDPDQLAPRRFRILGRRRGGGGLEQVRFSPAGVASLAIANPNAVNRGRRQIVFIEFDTPPGLSSAAVQVSRLRIDERSPELSQLRR